MIRLREQTLFRRLQLPLSIRASTHFQATRRVIAESVKVVFVTDGWTRITFDDGQTDLGPGSVLTIPSRVWCKGSPRGFVRTVSVYLQVEFLSMHLKWLPAAHPIIHHLLHQPSGTRAPGTLHLGEHALQVLRPKLALLAALNGTPCGVFATLARVADVFDDVAFLSAGNGIAPLRTAATRSVIPHGQVADAARALHDQLEHPWTVAKLAQTVALSESQLTRLFRQDLGTSPAAFLWNARADRMAEILAATDVTIAQAANATGWADSSTAGRAFKRRFGVSPRAFALQARTLGLLPSEPVLSIRYGGGHRPSAPG